MEEFDILCNWEAANGDNLKKIVFLSSVKKEFDLDSVSVDNCICLIRNSKDELKLKPELYIRSNLGLQQINILSEGSLIEIFGNHNEYLFTCEPDFIDDWGGMAVYQAKINLPNLHVCKLKFIHIKDVTRLWIYHIELTTVELEESSNYNLINIGNVNKLINNSNHELSKRAENFKKFFEMYANNTSHFKEFINQSFNCDHSLNNTGNKYISELINKVSQSQQSLNATDEKINSAIIPSDTINNMSEIPFKAQINPDEKNELERYIDKKLNELKGDILQHIDYKLNQFFEDNNCKLNKILALLKDLNNVSS